jgi:hypothetical protein
LAKNTLQFVYDEYFARNGAKLKGGKLRNWIRNAWCCKLGTAGSPKLQALTLCGCRTTRARARGAHGPQHASTHLEVVLLASRSFALSSRVPSVIMPVQVAGWLNSALKKREGFAYIERTSRPGGFNERTSNRCAVPCPRAEFNPLRCALLGGEAQGFGKVGCHPLGLAWRGWRGQSRCYRDRATGGLVLICVKRAELPLGNLQSWHWRERAGSGVPPRERHPQSIPLLNEASTMVSSRRSTGMAAHSILPGDCALGMLCQSEQAPV